MVMITLTEKQRSIIKADMEHKVDMLNDDEVEALASALNDKINLPFIKEGTEQIIFVKIVKKFDRFLYQNLPNELYELVKDTSDGISESDADQLAGVLGERLNNKFDIPYIPEAIEKEVFILLIDLIVTAMRNEFSILKQRESDIEPDAV